MDASSSNSSLLYSVDEKPPHWLSLSLGMQHICLMFTGVLIVPTILAKGGATPLEQIEYLAFASIIVCAVTSLIQTIRVGRIGAGHVIFMGTSGTFLACTFEAIEIGGLALAALMAMTSAPIEFLFAYFFRFLRKIITPAVGGTVIMLVSVSVMPITFDLWAGPEGSPGHNSPANLAVGLATLALILGVSLFGGRYSKVWAPIIGIAGGYLLAAMFGSLDLSTFKQAAWFGLPRADWPGITFDFKLEYLAIFFCFALATIVDSIESMADSIAVQKVSQREFRKVDYDVVQGTLYGDGLGNFLSGLAGIAPNTTYSGNIAMLELTGVAAKRVGIYGALFLGLLAFFPKVAALLIDIPGPAIGASIFILLCMLFLTGVRVAVMNGIDYETTAIVGIGFWVGYAAENGLFFSTLIPQELEPLLGNGMAMGGAFALLLSVLIRLKPQRRRRLRLPADAAVLRQLQDFIDGLDARFRIDARQRRNLHLCCEEIFIHLCQVDRDAQPPRTINVRVTVEEQGIVTEISDRSEAGDIDFPAMPADLATASVDDLDELGLFLVSKVASDVTHARISGYNYISFLIPA